jgi:hypothetical protein
MSGKMLMSRITFDWYDADKSVVYIRYHRGWSHQDVFHAFAETFEMLETVNHSVDLIIEMTEQHVPPNIISLASVLKNQISVNQRHTYYVNANPFIRILVRSAAAAIPAFGRVTFCQTGEEALKKLRYDRDGRAAHAAVASHRASFVSE